MTTMLYSGIPAYCPYCGRKWFHPPYTHDTRALKGWAGLSATCSGCGTHYRYVKEETLKKVQEESCE